MKLATQKEILENIRDELSVRPKNGHEGTTRYFSEEYREGFNKGAEVMDKIAKEREAKLVECLQECRNFTKDVLARVNKAIATDCPSCDYQCIGCINSVDDCESVKIKIDKALADHKRMMEGGVG